MHRLACLSLVLLLPALPAGAQSDPWRLCPAEPASLAIDPDYLGPPEIHADHLQSTPDGVTRLDGDVVLRQEGVQVRADRMWLRRRQGRIEAEGGVRYGTADFEVGGDRAEVDLDGDRLSLSPAQYRIPQLHAQGRAARAERDADDSVTLERASYTTCPPQAEAWAIRAGRIRLDQREEIGTAYNLHVDLFGVPVFWSPWISFPIGERRKSGLLMPAIGQSSNNGLEIILPWYWNIAPQADATITARNMSRRGLQLQNEVRYLNRQGEWQLDAEVLDDRLRGEQRDFYHLTHDGRLGLYGRTHLDLAGVSDADYFDELGADLSQTTLTHLRRTGHVSYADGTWTSRLQIDDWQTIDPAIAPAARPYRRLPRITLTTDPGPTRSGLHYRLDAEAVVFDRADSTTGRRLDLTPRLSWRLGSPAWYLEPGLAWRLTEYDLDRVDAGPERPGRSLPIGSLDAGLFLERRIGHSGHLQTLEPRIYYLHVPFEAQDDLPLFDTTELDFGFSQLFRENRFTGADRVGDANQLTLALSTRLLEDASGREIMSASIGQIRYFSDRRVGLSGTSPVADSDASDLVAEASASPSPAWRLGGQIQYDPQTELNARGALQVRYQRDNSHILNAGYRYRRDEQAQIDLSARWALGARWHLMARWNWSLLDDEPIEALAGFEYESCCWVLRLVSREYLSGTDDPLTTETERAIYTQLVLKGFSDVGRNLGELLEDAILGYRENPDPLD